MKNFSQNHFYGSIIQIRVTFQSVLMKNYYPHLHAHKKKLHPTLNPLFGKWRGVLNRHNFRPRRSFRNWNGTWLIQNWYASWCDVKALHRASSIYSSARKSLFNQITSFTIITHTPAIGPYLPQCAHTHLHVMLIDGQALYSRVFLKRKYTRK